MRIRPRCWLQRSGRERLLYDAQCMKTKVALNLDRSLKKPGSPRLPLPASGVGEKGEQKLLLCSPEIYCILKGRLRKRASISENNFAVDTPAVSPSFKVREGTMTLRIAQ